MPGLLVTTDTASSSRLVAPPGGARAELGTNPVAIAVPSSRGPIVLDMGTSAFMMTEVLLRERLGELLPEGVAIGPDGEPILERRSALGGHWRGAHCCLSPVTKASGWP